MRAGELDTPENPSEALAAALPGACSPVPATGIAAPCLDESIAIEHYAQGKQSITRGRAGMPMAILILKILKFLKMAIHSACLCLNVLKILNLGKVQIFKGGTGGPVARPLASPSASP